MKMPVKIIVGSTNRAYHEYIYNCWPCLDTGDNTIKIRLQQESNCRRSNYLDYRFMFYVHLPCNLPVHMIWFNQEIIIIIDAFIMHCLRIKKYSHQVVNGQYCKWL